VGADTVFDSGEGYGDCAGADYGFPDDGGVGFLRLFGMLRRVWNRWLCRGYEDDAGRP
jgi:hypothetical protein